MKKIKRLTRLKHAPTVSALLALSMLSQTSFADTGFDHQLRSEHDSNRFWHHSQERSQVWISDIGTLVFNDLDGDGYYSGFSLTIDLDSEYGETDVYAHLQLRSASQPLMHLHTSAEFSVHGSGIGDEYRIDTELRSNFASDDYDVVIDIREASSDRLLDTANARGFSNLSQLPLESSEPFDQLNGHTLGASHVNDSDNNAASSNVMVTEYAGALHPLLGLILLGGIVTRRSQICS